jgi:DNA-binding response OmpR family regulator
VTTTPCILLIDDNPDDRALAIRALRQDDPGLRVVEITTAEAFEQALTAGAFEVVVTDYLLRWSDGLTVLRRVKERRADCPVLLFTDSGSEEVAVEAMKAGADDYVIKPFHYQEVAARIRAVLRRRDSRREGPRRVGDVFIDPSRREVRVGDRPVALANKEFALLRALAAEPSRVFTKEELLRDVWGFRSMGRTRTLDSHASRLRRKLDPEAGRYVVNVWGVGYRLIDR